MVYNVKLGKFEGPLDLLLELIKKEEMNITELSLSKVTDEYLDYIRDNEKINLANMAEFLSVASRLILIKSRALLPILKFSDEEEEEIEDLKLQLEEYKKFKEASEKIGAIAKQGKISYSREGYKGVQNAFYPPEDFNIYDLKKYFLKILENLPEVEKLQEEVVSEIVSLEERINEMENSLRNQVEVSFSDIASRAKDKVDIIVSFLAILEMMKQRLISVRQDKLFEDIKFTSSGQSVTSSYNDQ